MQRSKKQEERIISNRGKALIIFCVFLFIVLFSRLVFLQFIDKERLENLRFNNILKTNYITPTRGNILDRNGTVIANNRELFTLIVIPEKISGFRSNKIESSKEFVNNLSKVIYLEEEVKEKLITKMRTTPLFTEIVIKSDLNIKELASITEYKKYMPSLELRASKVRNYPNGINYINVLGYVGKVSRSDLRNPDKFLTPLDYVGKKGIEKQKDSYLIGKHGEEVIGMNAHGKAISVKRTKESQKGNDISLTIDDEIQSLAYELLGEERGAIVAMNPNNGEILALASTPSYDPNKLIKGISHEEYKNIFMDINKSPFFNRALSGQYPPASTIKPFVSLAGLLGDWIDPEERVWCGPYYQLKGSTRRFNDWKPTGHGWIDMQQSIERSADVYYYRLGKEMGIDYIHDVLSYFNFGKTTELNLAGEKSGLLPSTTWKKDVKKEGWYTGETLIASIGQGYMLATPLQLAQATSILVNGGKTYKPYLLQTDEPEELSSIDIDEEYINKIKLGMRDVIFGKYGTARKWKNSLVRYDQGGKTGTSQVYSTKGERPDKDVEMPKHLRDHALYIGFAPFDNPEIVVSVIIENVGGGSTYAAPVGIEILQRYLDKYNPESLLENKINLREASFEKTK